MAAIGATPLPACPPVAIAALNTHLPTVLKHRTLEEAGWTRPDDLTLLVPVQGQVKGSEVVDSYLLRLHFGYYPEWPPSAQFVNPATQVYDPAKDACWLPKIEGTDEIAVHAAYQFENKALQLICCSVTLEFYLIRHGVRPEHVWNSERQNFASTINAVKCALRSQFYKGRQHALPTLVVA